MGRPKKKKRKRIVFEQKKEFQPAYTIYNTKVDFGLPAEHLFAMAADPSRDTLFGLIEVMADSMEADYDSMEEEELEELNTKFYTFVSKVIIDSDIDGLFFDTPEQTEEAMNSTSLDWHFMYSVLSSYVQLLLTTHEELGKVLTPLDASKDSGEEE